MSDTVMALLTPPGRGAIATLAIRGARAWDIARLLFQFPTTRLAATAPSLPAEPIAGRFWLGRLGETGKGGSDDVVLAVRQAAPVPWLDIHCHGGDQAVAMLQEVLARNGIVACSWQEFERHAGASRLQVLASEMLVQTTTTRTAAILLDQFHGALENNLRETLALLERNNVAAAAERLERLAARRQFGAHLLKPWRVVVAGAVNAGKSSLVNALAGFTRCLVSPHPGTTRDLVTTTIALDGWPIELVDTAGWRDTADPLERTGIDRARQQARDADLCLWLLDSSVAPGMPADFPANVQFVITKIDLPRAWNNEVRALGRVSAPTKTGLESFCTDLSNLLVPDPPTPGEAIPCTAELGEQIEQAAAACRAGQPERTSEILRHLLE